MDGTEEQQKKKKIKPGSFQGLGLGNATYKAIMRMGYKVPTPIQRKTIPTILEGQDLVAMARTGSGKTAAFLIPICERLKTHSLSVGFRAVVLSPTRELAMQTAKFCRQLSRFNDLRCCLLVGGQGMEAQFEHLANNPDLVIATPGRLMHHILEAELSLSRVEVLVFDEADRLFELGFADQLQKILDATPSSRQCLLFSATLPAQLVSFSRAGIKDPVFVRLDVETSLSDSLDLWYLFARKDEKIPAAISILRRFHQDEKTTIMFVATKHHVEFFGELLQQQGLPAAIVYGTMDQTARQEQVTKFRKKKARILVTTDVAARGVDIPLLDHVLNFDFPSSAKLFIHRCGRTARAGRSGLAASLVGLEDLPYTVELMTFLGHKLVPPSKANGSDANEEARGKTPVIGALPALDHEVEALSSVMADEGSLLSSLHRSMMASYNLYNKTRPSASKSSVRRAKELLEECGGPAQLQSMLHPAFRGKQTSQPGTLENSEYVRTLRGFRPKIEKLGNVLSVNAMRTMEQAKLDAAAVSEVRQSAGEACDAHSAEAEELELAAKPKGKRVPKAKPRDKPRLSKKARKMLKEGVEADDADFDIRISGGDAKPKRGEGEQFYLSTAVDLQAEAREKGFEMEQYQMDLLPDDSTDIKKAKSVMRWDAKRKKYLPTMVTADGKALKGQRRNESGKKVKGDGEKSKIYEKWSKATKRRIQKVGEVEDASADPLGKLQKSQARVVDFDAEGEVETARKPVVPFHGTVSEEFLTHKQKRALKKRAKLDTVAAGTEAKAELKTPQQIQQEKKLREKNKLKQKPWLRKAKARESKEARMKKLEERQMRYGARTKAKMLIFDGPRQWKKRAPAPQKGYGSRHSF
ncbi:unnamed protein product [Effrenium voratum]|uniref:RNA helicase n=1 Tax=Effrenium voratum TaxID=2562239 RepID=A0AA36NC46_9DINO|nr:unnamed protein product [Effrenium voratum]CAJ1432810.1 unnamed protein product [Effrenium voratum]